MDHPFCATPLREPTTSWQPIIDLAADTVVGHAVASPPPSGRWATAAALAVEAGDLDADRAAPAIHLGVLPSDLRRPYLIASIGRLPPTLRCRLVFDLPGHHHLGTAAGSEGAIGALRRLGVRFAVDAVDGWSNLRAIEVIRPEVIRLEQRPTGAGADRTARWVLELARSIDAATLVSGIQVDDDLAWARSLGFDLGQGPRWLMA